MKLFASTTDVSSPPSRRRTSTASWVSWPLIALVLVALSLAIDSSDGRSVVLRLVLLVLAAGEIGGAVTQAFARARDDGSEALAFLVSRQDFALYNLATSALLALTATDPARYVRVLEVTIALYALHGAAHVLRYIAVLTPRPDRTIELRQGLPLLSAAVGLLLFHP
jgi:hypothetical protein